MEDRPRHHGIADERQEAVRGHVLDPAQADAADALAVLLGGNRDNGLALDLPAPLVLFRAAHIGFVRFHRATEAIPPRADHRPAQLVQPRPGGLVAAEPQRALQTEGADAVLLAGDEPHGHEPGPERLARAFEDGAGGERGAPATAPAAHQIVRHDPSHIGRAAVRTDKAGRPAQAPDVITACCLVPEPIIHLLKGPRIVDAGNWACPTVHAGRIACPVRSVKGIPHFVQI